MNRSLAVSVLLTAALAAYADGPGLSLRVNDEAAPAGSTVQIKIDVTEPKPISTGRGKIRTRGIAMVQGIVLMNEGQDTFGVAMVDGDELSFAITSPSSLFGTPADYPILGIAGTVAGAPLGSSFPLTLDPAGLGFRDPSGALYPTEIKDGTLTVANVVAIGDVSPGSSVVPAGGVVRITGVNFTPDTRIDVGESDIAEKRFISSQQIDVVLAETTNMHGARIRARNDGKNDRSESEYFSYERTSGIGSNDPILGRAVPLFAPAAYATATVDFPVAPGSTTSRRKSRAVRPSRPSGGSSSNGLTLGLALQNLDRARATVTVELLDRFGHVYAVNTVAVGPSQYLVRELGEIFGIVTPPAAFRIRSNLSLQVLGLVADPATGTASALPPR